MKSVFQVDFSVCNLIHEFYFLAWPVYMKIYICALFAVFCVWLTSPLLQPWSLFRASLLKWLLVALRVRSLLYLCRGYLYILTGFNIFLTSFQRPLEHQYSALVQIKMGLVWGNTTISKKSLGTIERCGFCPFLQGKW